MMLNATFKKYFRYMMAEHPMLITRNETPTYSYLLVEQIH